jgi:uncharacterized protein YhaN
LRLGAVAEYELGVLPFERSKGGSNSLRTPADQPLAANALQGLLGNIDRDAFEQMFAMDLGTMLKGGRQILDASSNLGQMLFQSAAGIDSLGNVLTALRKEADDIWGARKSANRSYYIALDKFEQARRAVQDASVRTQSWTDAHAGLEQALAKLEAEKQRYEDLKTRRIRLERVRRTGLDLAALNELEAALAALGQVVEFPADAAQRLASAQAELDRAVPVLEVRRAQVQALQQQLDAIVTSDSLLDAAPLVQELVRMAGLYGNHARDLPVRQKEVENLLADIALQAGHLGWATDEASVRAAMPSPLELARIAELVKTRGATESAFASAAASVQKKEAELARVQADLDALEVTAVSAGLEPALLAAQALQQAPGQLHKAGAALAAQAQEVETRLAALAPWRKPIAELQAMFLPAEERLAQLRAERAELALEKRTLAKSVTAARARVELTELEISQFREARRVVTAADVKQARGKRDHAWLRIKTGELDLAAGAPGLDEGMQLADELVDSQLGSVSESAHLLGLQQRLQQEMQELQQREKAAQTCCAALDALASEWKALCEQAGLPGMAIDDMAAWLIKRSAALSCAADLQARQAELAAQQAQAAAAFDLLRAELRLSGAAIASDAATSDPLACARAQLAATQAGNGKRQAWADQLASGRAELVELQRITAHSSKQRDAWHQQWEQALARVKLERFKDSVSAAEEAVAMIGQMQARLDKARQIRTERIDDMHADLERFALAAARLAAAIDPALQTLEPAAIAHALGARLQADQAARTRAEGVRESLEREQQLVLNAELDVASARRSLAPLFALGGVHETEALAPLVRMADRKRELQSRIAGLKGKLLDTGDGLSLAQIGSEVQEQDLSAVAGQLQTLSEEENASIATQVTLHEQCVTARQVLDAIAGAADAAHAEARRQEALSDMAQACERYVKVAAAGVLLKWGIDRYRERKQGPLLARAGEIFSALTLKGFSRLAVDFEKEKYQLTGLRDNGVAVGIDGMSEGTRDQLFLALRLAALELQLGQSTPLPFIADDLFVNFDDLRTRAGLQTLAQLSRKTQVIFLSHHEHMLPLVQEVFGEAVNVVRVPEPALARAAMVA